MVTEVRVDMAVPLRQGCPQLYAMQDRRVIEWTLLRMRNRMTGGHQIQLAWYHQLVTAHTVPVQHLPRDQPADRLQSGVRVRRNLHPRRAADVIRAIEVDETPGADHAALTVGQRAGHRHRPRATQRDGATKVQLPHRLNGDRRPAATLCLPRVPIEVTHRDRTSLSQRRLRLPALVVT